MPRPCCAGPAYDDVDRRGDDRCRCRVLSGRRAGAGPRHRRGGRTVAVRGAHLHAADATDRLLDPRGVRGRGTRSVAPHGAHGNDLEPAALEVEPRVQRTIATRWQPLAVAPHGSPAVAARGSSKAPIRARVVWWRARYQRRSARKSAKRERTNALTCRLYGVGSASLRSIFLCFFLRIRLRRFLTREPIAGDTVAGQ